MPREAVYQRIIDAIEQAIASGELAPGARLPSIGQLAFGHQAGETTVKKALKIMEARGLVVSRQGKAFYVAGEPEVGPE